VYIVIWEYHVKPENQTEFETIYASNGEWAQLFKKGKGYLGTEFFHSEEHASVFMTIDRWATREDYETFLTQYQSDYKALDNRCEDLTEGESLLTKWSTDQQIEED